MVRQELQPEEREEQHAGEQQCHADGRYGEQVKRLLALRHDQVVEHDEGARADHRQGAAENRREPERHHDLRHAQNTALAQARRNGQEERGGSHVLDECREQSDGAEQGREQPAWTLPAELREPARHPTRDAGLVEAVAHDDHGHDRDDRRAGEPAKGIDGLDQTQPRQRDQHEQGHDVRSESLADEEGDRHQEDGENERNVGGHRREPF